VRAHTVPLPVDTAGVEEGVRQRVTVGGFTELPEVLIGRAIVRIQGRLGEKDIAEQVGEIRIEAPRRTTMPVPPGAGAEG